MKQRRGWWGNCYPAPACLGWLEQGTYVRVGEESLDFTGLSVPKEGDTQSSKVNCSFLPSPAVNLLLQGSSKGTSQDTS